MDELHVLNTGAALTEAEKDALVRRKVVRHALGLDIDGERLTVVR